MPKHVTILPMVLGTKSKKKKIFKLYEREHRTQKNNVLISFSPEEIKIKVTLMYK